MISTHRQLLLYISNSNNRVDVRTFSFYMAIRGISHKGVIHSYRKILPLLCNKLGVSDSLFRRKVSDCKKEGWLFEDEKKGLRFKSPRKILQEAINLYPDIFKTKRKSSSPTIGRRKFFNSYKKYSEIILWVKATVLFNKSCQQNYAESKRLQLKNEKGNTNLNIRAFQRNSVSISRKKIALLINRRSKSSATNLMKKMKDLGIVNYDNRKIKLVKSISKAEYRERYFNKGGYYYHNGMLYRVMCNKIQYNTSCFMIEQPYTGILNKLSKIRSVSKRY